VAGDGKACRVIGLGNPDRGDDGAGRAVARWLAGRLPPGVEILERGGEAADLLACLEGAAAVYLVDASALAGAPGRVRRFDAAAAPLPAQSFAFSTHGLGLAEAVELARALGSLPPRCVVYAIEGRDFAPGAPLSPAVAAAVAEAGGLLTREIGA
jgi:hydrogenase maturation protease